MIQNRKSVATMLGCGLLAGLAGGVSLALINQLSLDPIKVRSYNQIRSVIICLVVYSLVSIAFHRLWPTPLAHVLPDWAMTAIVGSLLVVAVLLGPGVVLAWQDPRRTDPFWTFAGNEISAASSLMLMLLIVTLPVAASVRYYTRIRRAVGLWHEGPKPMTIISRRNTIDGTGPSI